MEVAILPLSFLPFGTYVVFLHHKRATRTKHFGVECMYVDEQESFVINFHPLELAL